ncbi:hypothetical protein CCP2SC5_70052 [Azospirillaceae bacterium]
MTFSSGSSDNANTPAPHAGWEWLQQPAPSGNGGGNNGGSDNDLVLCFARCFSNADGARVLSWLRSMTLDRSLGPNASDASLRHLEGQRFLVHSLLALISRGRRPAPIERKPQI